MRIRAFVAGITVAGCTGLTVVAPSVLGTMTADAAPWPGHPDRNVISYTVRPGDTLYGLAVRYHAWTAELASLNHLTTSSELRVGQHLRIPEVVSRQHDAAAKARTAKAARIARAVSAVRAHYAYPHATAWRGHPDRILITRTVRSGDSIYSLAVHYRAWTREIASLNHVSTLRVGQRIRIPIVTSVMRKAEQAAIAQAKRAASAPPRKAVRQPTRRTYAQRMKAAGWSNWAMSQSQIRSIIVATARHHGVDPLLALAIGWQESGWHQPLVSSAGAIGVMQLLPSTASWMGAYAGRSLNPRHTRENILAGVLFLKYLGNLAGPHHRNQIIAGYYQGMTALGKKRFWYEDTKRYVRSVSAIYRSLS